MLRMIQGKISDSSFMPRFGVAFILILSLFGLMGCGSTAEVAAQAEDKNVPLVVSTIFPGYDFARHVGGDKAVCYQLLSPGAESHTYEPTPQDMILIKNCDVFIYAGGESDTWIEDLLADDLNPDRTVISMMDCVNAVTEEETEGMREGGLLAEFIGEEEEEEYDEHVWTSPSNASKITEKITEVLCSGFPEYSEYYISNADKYEAALSELDSKYRKLVEGAKRRTIVVGDRFPFRYLCDEYSLDYYAAFPGCAEDAEVTADTLVTLCNIVKSEEIPVVFCIEFSSGKIADSICECTDAKKMTLHSAHNVSTQDLKRGVTYIDIMESNLLCLKEALY